MVRREDDGGACIGKHAVWFIICAILFLMPDNSRSCRLEACLIEYSSGLEQGGVKGPESTAAYCQHLKAYGSCVRAASRSCRGDLQYHSTWSIISTLTKRFNCSRFRQKPQRQDCSYLGRQNYSYCTLYGRPHLLTFSALYHNCKLQESTALIDNQFFSVVVTRGNLESQNSLVSEINITIKSGGTPCASEKQYVAYADQELPLLFLDQTQTGGIKNSILINSSWEGPTENIFIYLRYIDTTVVVKKSGSYFGFSCRMPSDILNFDPGGVELCRSGCTDSDMLDVESARLEQNEWRNAVEKCSQVTKLGSGSADGTFWRQRDRCLFDVMSSYSRTEKTTIPPNNFPEENSVPSIEETSSSQNKEDVDKFIVLSKGFLVRFSPFIISILLVTVLL